MNEISDPEQQTYDDLAPRQDLQHLYGQDAIDAGDPLLGTELISSGFTREQIKEAMVTADRQELWVTPHDLLWFGRRQCFTRVL